MNNFFCLVLYHNQHFPRIFVLGFPYLHNIVDSFGHYEL